MASNDLTPAQRAQLFAQSTRQNLQMLPPQTATGGAQTLQFNLPKARLLSNIMLRVEAKVSGSGTAWSGTNADLMTPFKLIRRVSLDLNNGFSPYTIGGTELALLNMVSVSGLDNFLFCSAPEVNNILDTHFNAVTMDKTEMVCTLQLPVTLNGKEPTGLILLQNAETNIQLTVDIANDNDLFDNKENVSVKLVSVKVTPLIETFSIPSVQQAFPDLSVLKLCNSRNEGFMGNGQNIIKLTTGTIYRKLIFRVTDENGEPFKDADFTSNIDLVFNQADVNYSVNANALRMKNMCDGVYLPEGCFAFDFSSSGFLPNYGGTRDFIDTSLLTEFWLRFSSSKRGKISIITEQIARLK